MKRLSKKAQYIQGIVWELEHFKEELKRTEPPSGEKFKDTIKRQGICPIWYLGEQYTRYGAERRVLAYERELAKIDEDQNYKPWKDGEDESMEYKGEPVKGGIHV